MLVSQQIVDCGFSFQYLKTGTKQEERALCDELFEEGVYTIPGTAMFSTEPGWFRVTFSIRRHKLDLGMYPAGTVAPAS